MQYRYMVHLQCVMSNDWRGDDLRASVLKGNCRWFWKVLIKVKTDGCVVIRYKKNLNILGWRFPSKRLDKLNPTRFVCYFDRSSDCGPDSVSPHAEPHMVVTMTQCSHSNTQRSLWQSRRYTKLFLLANFGLFATGLSSEKNRFTITPHWQRYLIKTKLVTSATCSQSR